MRPNHPLSRLAAIAVPALASAALLALASAALAHTYTPTRFDDPAPNGCKPHNCSLREAIINANHHPGADEVVLAGGKTYNLSIAPNLMDDETNGDLNLTDSVKLTSSNRKLATIDGGNIDDVIHSGEVGGVHASLTRLRLRHGNGAIELMGGSLALSRSVLSGNTSTVFGGGIDGLKGTLLKVSRSRVSGNHASVNAGGIATNGSALISRSTISANSAGSAAGGLLIEDQSPGVTVKNSTISGNHAKDQGGGIVCRQQAAEAPQEQGPRQHRERFRGRRHSSHGHAQGRAQRNRPQLRRWGRRDLRARPRDDREVDDRQQPRERRRRRGDLRWQRGHAEARRPRPWSATPRTTMGARSKSTARPPSSTTRSPTIMQWDTAAEWRPTPRARPCSTR